MDKLNPLASAAIGSILRAGLIYLAGYLVNWGIWTNAEAGTYVEGAVVALIWAAWTWWKNHRIQKTLEAALAAPAGATLAEVKATMKPTLTLPIIVLAAILGAGGVFWGCAQKVPPNVGPAGKVAYQAKNITDAASTALGAIELFTDQGLIAKPVAIDVIKAIRSVGLAGNALADGLRIYATSKGVDGKVEIRTTIQRIQTLITDALVLVPDLPTRQRIQAITKPILDALSAILLPLDDILSPDFAAMFTLADWNRLTTDANAALARLAQ